MCERVVRHVSPPNTSRWPAQTGTPTREGGTYEEVRRGDRGRSPHDPVGRGGTGQGPAGPGRALAREGRTGPQAVGRKRMVSGRGQGSARVPPGDPWGAEGESPRADGAIRGNPAPAQRGQLVPR